MYVGDVSASVHLFSAVRLHVGNHMLVALGKQDREGEWNDDDGNVETGVEGRGVHILCAFLSFFHFHERSCTLKFTFR